MKDIASDLGLSLITVSKALRNHPDVATQTRERILKRAQELDYQPNILARSLVTGHSYLIGLVVPGLIHPFYAELAMALSSVVGKRGYSVIISSSEQDPELESREIRQLLARRLDGLVIAACGQEMEAFQQMDRLGQPYLLIDQQLPGLDANFVGVDDEAIGRLATEHLADQGCQNIAHIQGAKGLTGSRRLEGYRQALLQRGLDYDPAHVVVCSKPDIDGISQGAKAMHYLLEQTPRPDGIFCFNDPLAIGAMNAILEKGLRIPQDVAVVGCGNSYFGESLKLSSVDQNCRSLGERAGQIILSVIESKKKAAHHTVILSPNLVQRASSMRSKLSV
jgi:LacI family transcriptional regulator